MASSKKQMIMSIFIHGTGCYAVSSNSKFSISEGEGIFSFDLSRSLRTDFNQDSDYILEGTDKWESFEFSDNYFLKQLENDFSRLEDSSKIYASFKLTKDKVYKVEVKRTNRQEAYEIK